MLGNVFTLSQNNAYENGKVTSFKPYYFRTIEKKQNNLFSLAKYYRHNNLSPKRQKKDNKQQRS